MGEASEGSDNVESRECAKCSHHIGGRRKCKPEVGNRSDKEFDSALARSADKIPFAPGERFVDGDEVGARNFLDEFGLAGPLSVGADFVFGHGGEGVHFVRKAADRREFGDEVDEGEKRSAPRLDEHDAAVGTKDALHFGKSLIEIIGQSGEMVKAALNDEDIFAAIREGKLAAIGDGAFCATFELGDEAGRKVHSFDASEAEALESDQAVAASAEKFNDFRIARPLTGAEAIETGDELLNFLFGGFETQVGGLPGIGSEGVRNGRVWIGGAIFH